MEQPSTTELNDLVEGVLNASKRDANGVEIFDEAYLDHDGTVKASIAQWGNNRRKTSWLVEVGVLVDRTPFEVTEVVFKSSLDGGGTWSKPREGAPESLKEQGARIREHVVGLRDAGRFATTDQGLAAVLSEDPDGLAEGTKRAQALLCRITPDVPAPAPEPRKRGPKPRTETDAPRNAGKRFNLAGLMGKVNELRIARGEDPVPRKEWPADRREAQPYVDEVRSAAATLGPR